MCLTVYIGSDMPFRSLGPPEKEGGIELSVARITPNYLAERKFVAEIVDWHEGEPGCSCDFIEMSLPWKVEEEDEQTILGFDRLREEIFYQTSIGGNPTVFAAWVGLEGEDPAMIWRLSPSHLTIGHNLFSANHLYPTGLSDIYFLTFDESLEKPEYEIPNVL